MRHPVVLTATLFSILLALCAGAPALDPSLDVSQYAHTAWKIRDGFVKGEIHSIAQTPDGYLWLGTEFGLVRFDGVRIVPWIPPSGGQLPSTNIWSLLAARDGTLWIGTANGLASWKDGKLTQYADLNGQYVFRLLEDREGTVWAGAVGIPTGRLCAIQNGRILVAGKLTVWSEIESGTEVVLSIPGSSAYVTPGRRRLWLSEKLSGKGMDGDDADGKGSGMKP